MRSARGAFAGVVLAYLLTGGGAAAQNSAASAAAEKLFREGKALAAAQRYEQAIEKFKASQELESSVGVLLSLGDAYRAGGRIASAWSAYTSARDLAKTKGDARVVDAEQRANEVSSRLPRLTIRISVVAAELSVTDNGLALPSASFGSSLPVDPGTHAIVVTARNRKTYRTSETLFEGQSREVTIPALELEEPPAPSNDERGGDPQRTIGSGFLIGGGAMAVAGVVFGGLAATKWSTVTDACPDRVCDSNAQRASVQDDARSADRFAIVSTIGISVGVVAIAAGLLLRLTAPSKAIALAPRLGGQSLELGCAF